MEHPIKISVSCLEYPQTDLNEIFATIKDWGVDFVEIGYAENLLPLNCTISDLEGLLSRHRLQIAAFNAAALKYLTETLAYAGALGVKVVILEKHEDFFRDFRGDTIHPSTLEVMHELGLLEEFLKIPHQKLYSLNVNFGPTRVPIADFSHIPLQCKYIAFMPQWDFLNFLADQGKKYPNFDLRMNSEAIDLIEENGQKE